MSSPSFAKFVVRDAKENARKKGFQRKAEDGLLIT